MKKIHLQALTVILSATVTLAGCASTGPEKTKYRDGYKIPSSILAGQNARVENTQENLERPDQRTQTHTDRISIMGQLQRGTPLLTEVPRFVNQTPVKVAVNEMEAPRFVNYIFGEVLGLNYVIASDVERMREKVALNLQSDIEPLKLFEVSREVLSQLQIDVYTKDNIVYINRRTQRSVSKAVGIGSLPEDLPANGEEIIQLIPYTFNSARSIMSMISKLTNATVSPDITHRLLVVEGTRADVERALQIVNMMDVPHARGRDIRMMGLVYLSPEEAITQLNNLMVAEGLSTSEDIQLVPLQRLSALVVYSANATIGNRVQMWIEKLDVATGGEVERFYVYRPQYSKATELAQSVNVLLNASGRTEEGARPANPPAKSTGSAIQISADEVQNALIVRSTPTRYRELIGLLEQLDRLPGQIALQVVVAEVVLSDNVASGIDWFYNSTANEARRGQLDLNSNSGILAFTGFRGDWRVAMSLLDSQTDTRVLSQPYLIVRDGESASISSGDQVPIITETSSSDTTPDRTRATVQYRSTGISLSVTPTINADGLVSLQISQETSNSKPTTGFEVATPTITTRSLSTSVLAANGQTVILGGLIQENITNQNSKVPFLGTIPVLGNLFKSKGEDFSRTELMVLITPRIIMATTELDELNRKLSELFTFPTELPESN